MEGKFHIMIGTSKMDIGFIYGYLSKKAYWSKGRSRELVLKSMENSMCFGVFDSDNQQIAFARLVTDYVVFAWLMDVFVDEAYREQGIGKMLIEHIVGLPELRQVNGMGLRTEDAHGLYEKFGFKKIDSPETWMLRKKEKNENYPGH